MGSSGSSSFSDYSEQNSSSPLSSNGGSSKTDKCNNAFAASLEEVSRCQYYQKIGIPPVGTEVYIVFNQIRLVAIDTTSGQEIGYLPTKFNYIKTCLDNGFTYSGRVASNLIRPTPSVLIDIVPS